MYDDDATNDAAGFGLGHLLQAVFRRALTAWPTPRRWATGTPCSHLVVAVWAARVLAAPASRGGVPSDLFGDG